MGTVPGTASAVNHLLDHALDYHGRGWSVIPTTIRKEARFAWKQFQEKPPAEALVRDWFSGRHDGIAGVAAITGAASGGLAIRDFDRLSSYESWAATHPDLAATLPTAATARGKHLFFRGPEGYHEYDDGEYRADAKHITVLPPSQHPSGPTYQWVVPLPRGELPVIDPGAAGLLGSWCNREHREYRGDREYRGNRGDREGTEKPPLCFLLQPEALPQAEAVLQAIDATLPSTQGQRRHCLFRLARHLKGIDSLRDSDAGALRPVIQEWHRRALPVVGTKPFLESWADFVQAWRTVRVPIGEGVVEAAFVRAAAREPPPRATGLYGEGPIVLLAALCRELQEIAGEGDFPLDCRTAGRLIGVDYSTAWRYLDVLCADRVLKAGPKGESNGGKATGKASRFRYVEGGGA